KSELNTCWSCHHEHQGADFPIDWGKGGAQAFEHKRTGWPLLGKHAAQGCSECHQTRRIAEKSVLQLLKAHPARKTYLGLSHACSDCPFDEHRGQLDQPCRNCHTEQGWKPAPGFNHNHDTAYPLRGKHAEVKCAGCHALIEDKETKSDAFPAPRQR